MLNWSESKFGSSARLRYATLLVTAMGDLAANPDHPNAVTMRIGRRGVRLYHVGHSRRQVPKPPGSVAKPRHLIVARVADDGVLEVLGLVHERMLRSRALRSLLRDIGEG